MFKTYKNLHVNLKFSEHLESSSCPLNSHPKEDPDSRFSSKVGTGAYLVCPLIHPSIHLSVRPSIHFTHKYFSLNISFPGALLRAPRTPFLLRSPSLLLLRRDWPGPGPSPAHTVGSVSNILHSSHSYFFPLHETNFLGFWGIKFLLLSFTFIILFL